MPTSIPEPRRNVTGSPGEVAEPVPANGLLDASWTVVSRVIAQLTQLALIMIAARFLGVAEFGVFALVSAISIALTYLAEAGWREYIMAADNVADQARAHTCALVTGTFCTMLGLVASGTYWLATSDDELAVLMAALAVWVVLSAVSTAQAGVLIHRGKLVALAQIQLFGEICGFGVGLFTLWSGWGAMALAAGKLTMQVVVLAGTVATTRWFALVSPRESFASSSIIIFSRRILAMRLLYFGQGNASMFIVGAFFGPAGVGLFRAGGRFAGSLGEVIGEPLKRIAWSTLFSTRKAEPELNAANLATRVAYERLVSMSIVVASPLFVGLAAASTSTVVVLLGREWEGAAPLLALMAISRLITLPGSPTEALLALHNHVEWLQYLALAGGIVNLVCLIALAPFGLEWAAASQLLSAMLTVPLMVWVHQRYGGVSWKRIIREVWPVLFVALPAMGCMVLVVAQLTEQWNAVWSLIAQISVGALVYALLLLVVAPRRANDIRALFAR